MPLIDDNIRNRNYYQPNASPATALPDCLRIVNLTILKGEDQGALLPDGTSERSGHGSNELQSKKDYPRYLKCIKVCNQLVAGYGQVTSRLRRNGYMGARKSREITAYKDLTHTKQMTRTQGTGEV